MVNHEELLETQKESEKRLRKEAKKKKKKEKKSKKEMKKLEKNKKREGELKDIYKSYGINTFKESTANIIENIPVNKPEEEEEEI